MGFKLDALSLLYLTQTGRINPACLRGDGYWAGGFMAETMA